MRYLIVLALVILGTTFGFLGYQAWTAGPPVVLPAPAYLEVSTGGTPLLASGWTSSPTLDLKMKQQAAAGMDIEVQPVDTAFTESPTLAVKSPQTCGTPACSLLHVHLTDGSYHLQVRLHADRGVSPWVVLSKTIKVDTVPPVAPLITSSTDSNPKLLYHTSTMRFAWHTSDDGSGVAGYGYRLDSNPNGVPLPDIRTGTPTVTLQGLETGQYYFHVRAVDIAGNWGPTSTFPVKIDVTPPGIEHVRFSTFTFDPQYNGLTISFTITKPAKSVHVGVYSQTDHSLVRFYTLNSLYPGQQIAVTWDGKTQTGALAPAGLYQVYVRATDAYGHSSLMGWNDLAVVYKRIVVSLGQQKLWAYDGNSLYLTSLVTSGNPKLPTPLGTFTIMAKFHPFTFHSPWPKSSPYWYPPSPTQWAMLFREGGYFIHDAPWRSNFGPGSNAQIGTPGQNYTGTHGCVNVPSNIAQELFAWAPIGTEVVVEK